MISVKKSQLLATRPICRGLCGGGCLGFEDREVTLYAFGYTAGSSTEFIQLRPKGFLSLREPRFHH